MIKNYHKAFLIPSNHKPKINSIPYITFNHHQLTNKTTLLSLSMYFILYPFSDQKIHHLIEKNDRLKT